MRQPVFDRVDHAMLPRSLPTLQIVAPLKPCMSAYLQRPGRLVRCRTASGNSRACKPCCSAFGDCTGVYRPQRTVWQQQPTLGGVTVNMSGMY
jgi:hypothetical protein